MGDDWMAVDKLQHFVACLFITNFVTYLASSVRRLRRWRTYLGALAGLVAGAVKEGGDATGLFWPSAGASMKDGLADMAGVVAGVFIEVLIVRSLCRQRTAEQPKDSVLAV